MVVTLIGVALLIGGVVFVFLGKAAQNRLVTLLGTKTFTVKTLQDLCSAVAGEIGKGSFKEMAEVKGVVECDSPLTSELAKEKCVYYRNEVEREYEETYYEEDSQTHRRELKTRRGSETISSNTRHTDFYVRDDTGRIKINPDRANIDLIQVTDKYEPANSSSVNISGSRISWGTFSFNIGAEFGLTREGRRALGYKFREYIFPLNQNVFVLGEASDSMGELAISNPTEKGGQFIISTKSEEELTAGAKKNIQYFKLASIGCFVLGVILTIAGFFIK